jgi:hypothetical protein
MSNKKQTAVEWLEEMIAKMEAYGGDLPPLMIHINQAKAMEKEQIENAWDDGAYGITNWAEEYYKETYG